MSAAREAGLVVGAGIAGLTFARAVGDHRVLERSKRPGGRCATRPFNGVACDYGPVFLHAEEPELVELLAALPQTRRWPERVAGGGRPCQPGSLDEASARFVPREGVNALARHLARDLAIDFDARVDRVAWTSEGWRVECGGDARTTSSLVLTLPAPQTAALLASIDDPDVRAVRRALELVVVVPCLALVAHYSAAEDAPDWELYLGGPRDPIQLVSRESSKRDAGAQHVFVVQGGPAWSSANLERDPSAWSETLLEALKAVHPLFHRAPTHLSTHRWRHARIDGPGLAGPVALRLPGGARLGLAGECFDPQGGIEGAWRSGHRLARLFRREDGL